MGRLKSQAICLIAVTAISCTVTYLYKLAALDVGGAAVGIDNERGATVVDSLLIGTWDARDRLAVYSAISRTTDAAELNALLGRLAAEPSSTARDFMVASALSRLHEIDPDDALNALSLMGWEAKFVSDLFFEIAMSDPQAALESISMIELPQQKLTAGAAILDAKGAVDFRDLDLVSSALPDHLRSKFRIEAIGHLASSDPLAALNAVSAFPDRDERIRALYVVGEAVARRNPYEIVELCVNTLPLGERSTCITSAFMEWSRLDPVAVFDYYDSKASIASISNSAILTLLAASDPERAIRLASTLEGEEGEQKLLGGELKAVAFLELAAADPSRAISLLGPGSNDAGGGTLMLEALARSYAARDPDAALNWVQSLDSNLPRARANAVAGIGQTDLARAIRLLSDPMWEVDEELASMMIVSQLASQPHRMEELANLLLANHPMRASMLERLVPVWMQHQPSEALAWMNFHSDSIEATLFRAAARSLSAQDVARTAEYYSQIPTEEARREWVSAMVEPFARRDPEGLIRWIETQHGQPWHEEMLQRVAVLTASADPRRAAMLLTNARLPVRFEAASRIAAAWSSEEPAAAAQWAMTLQDGRSRSTAVTRVVDNWFERDAYSAEKWVMTLPRGPLRDDALGALIANGVTNGDSTNGILEGRLFDSFSSDSSRHSIVGRIAPALAGRDAGIVEKLLDSYVTDPDVRQDIEQAVGTTTGTLLSN